MFLAKVPRWHDATLQMAAMDRSDFAVLYHGWTASRIWQQL